MQANFVGFIEVFGFRASGVKAAIEVQQVSVVLIGGAEPVDHELRQRGGFVGFFPNVLPAGKRSGTALRRFESVEINEVRVEAGNALLLEQLAGDFACHVLQARAGQDHLVGNGLERCFVYCVGQRTGFG
nr:hypothetical protein [Pseudomonas sp. Sample_10]